MTELGTRFNLTSSSSQKGQSFDIRISWEPTVGKLWGRILWNFLEMFHYCKHCSRCSGDSWRRRASGQWRSNKSVFQIKQRRAGPSIWSITVLKLEEIHVTFAMNNVDAMFVGILLRDLARDFCVEFWELAPSRDFQNRFARGQKTIGSHLNSGFSSMKQPGVLSLPLDDSVGWPNNSPYTPGRREALWE